MKLRLLLPCLILLAGLAPARAATISATGLTEPILDAVLSTPVTGIVQARKFQEGAFIKEGTVLVELDRGLEELEVARRQLALEPLKSDLEASQFLFKQPKSSVSKELLDKKQLDFDVALAEHELAREQLRRRSVIAPFDGTIIDFFVQLGEACQIQQPILRLVDTRRCYFVSHVESQTGYALKVGQAVELEIEAGRNPVRLTGKISFVSPVVDPASGLLKVKVIFENPDGAIRPGVAGKMFFQEASYAQQSR
jgi:RND family efflux transporter MFP subunit